MGNATHVGDTRPFAEARAAWKALTPEQQLRLKTGKAHRSDHARAAIVRGGRRVRCAGFDVTADPADGGPCGYRTKLRTHSGRRLRTYACPQCHGRLRPENWAGWDLLRDREVTR